MSKMLKMLKEKAQTSFPSGITKLQNKSLDVSWVSVKLKLLQNQKKKRSDMTWIININIFMISLCSHLTAAPLI